MKTNTNYTTRNVPTTDSAKTTKPGATTKKNYFKGQFNTRDTAGGKGGTTTGGYTQECCSPRTIK